MINLNFFSGSIYTDCLAPAICHLDFLDPFQYLLCDSFNCDYIIAYINLVNLFRYIVEYFDVLPHIGILTLHSAYPQVLQFMTLTQSLAETCELGVTDHLQEVGMAQC